MVDFSKLRENRDDHEYSVIDDSDDALEQDDQEENDLGQDLEYLTVPYLKTTGGNVLVVFILKKLYSVPDVNRETGEQKYNEDGSKKTMTQCDCINLQTGMYSRFVVLKVLQSTFEKLPNFEYVGQTFKIIIPKNKVPNKKYKDVHVIKKSNPKNIERLLATLLPPLPRTMAEVLANRN